jgi:4-hydroxybenzoate polyprenyltransferase
VRTVVALARCSHLAPTVAVTTFATVLAVTAGKRWWAAGVGAAVLAGQLSVGWSNDWLDRERDRAVGRTDKPLVAGGIADGTVLRSAVAAAAASVVLSLVVAGAGGMLHVTAVAAAWSYNLRLKGTLLSPLPYGLAFGLLPAFITQARPLPLPAPWWAVAAGALLGVGAHFTNVLADFDDDERTGVRGLPHRLGANASTVLAAMSLGAGLAVMGVAAEGLSPVSWILLAAGGALVGGVLVAGATGRGRLAFRLTILAAAAAVGTLLSVGL